MIQGVKFPKSGLLLAGLAAYAYYKYNKMTDEEKRNLTETIKDKGRKFYNDYVPDDIKNVIERNTNFNTATVDSDNENITL